MLRHVDSKIQVITFNKKKGINLRLIWITYRKLKKLKPDIVHTHSIGLFYSILYVLDCQRSKIFYTVHSLANKDAPFYYRIIYWYLFKFYKVKTISISQAVSESFRRIYKMNCYHVIYHGVKMNTDKAIAEEAIKEINGYKKSVSSSVFVNVARVSEEKNQQLLIESFNILMQKHPDLLLLIIGGTKSELLLNKLKGISGPDVYFLGIRDNIIDFLKMSDAFCLTSFYEGLSLATIEALAMRVIPICTPIGGIPEVVKDGYNGILSEDCTIASYIKALERFLSMSDYQKQVIRDSAFSSYKEKFTLEKCEEAYLRLYNDAIKAKK